MPSKHFDNGRIMLEEVAVEWVDESMWEDGDEVLALLLLVLGLDVENLRRGDERADDDFFLEE